MLLNEEFTCPWILLDVTLGSIESEAESIVLGKEDVFDPSKFPVSKLENSEIFVGKYELTLVKLGGFGDS